MINNEILNKIKQIWNFNDPDATQNLFNNLLLALNYEQEEEKAILLTQIARTHSLLFEFTQAFNILEEFKNIYYEKNFIVANVYYYLELGRTYNTKQETDTAITFFNNAANLAIKHNLSVLAIDALHMLAIASPLNKQIAYNEKALQIAENSIEPEAKNWLPAIYNNLGWAYFDSNKLQKALIIFNKALTLREQQNSFNEIIIAKWCIARTKRALGDINNALNQQLALAEELKTKLQPNDGYVFEEIAECYYALNNLDAAKQYFVLAYDVLSKDPWLKQKNPQKLKNLLNKCTFLLPIQFTAIKGYFDENNKICEWPSKKNKNKLQLLVLQYIASKFVPEHNYTENEVNEIIKNHLSYADYVLIRRELIINKLLDRTNDGKKYWKTS